MHLCGLNKCHGHMVILAFLIAGRFNFISLVLIICAMTRNWTLEYKIKINRSGLY